VLQTDWIFLKQASKTNGMRLMSKGSPAFITAPRSASRALGLKLQEGLSKHIDGEKCIDGVLPKK
jgi:hypothetical protein